MSVIRSNAQKINESISELMENNENVICMGLGVTDIKGVFGTTIGLEDKYGPERVFDIPTSENAITGVAVGAAISGSFPILTHQRFDFALLSIDQLVNSAAKWSFMFGEQFKVPITVRMIVGRGWGQGPTHSQDYSSWFLNVPGIRLIYLSRPQTIRSIFKQAVMDEKPCIIMEHRWIHNFSSADEYEVSLDQGCDILTEGSDLTLVTTSYNSVLMEQCHEFFNRQNITIDHIDLFELNDHAIEKIRRSVVKTGRLYCVDTSHKTGSLSSFIVSEILCETYSYLKSPPRIFARPDLAEPTSFGMTRNSYPSISEVLDKMDADLGTDLMSIIPNKMKVPELHDVPGGWFEGPF